MNDLKTDLKVLCSRHFAPWLAQEDISLAFSTYQSGKLFLLGRKPECELAVFERTFNRCMGLWGDGETLWASTAFQLWRFDNVLAPSQTEQGYDRLFVPRVGYTTGDLDIHDLAIGKNGEILFISTLFSCLGTLSTRHSFKPLWRPPFVSKLAAEDRCHLNGLAMLDGEPAYVTATARTDTTDGWRNERRNGGCLVRLSDDAVIAEGLSMPHSPRWYQGRLWLLDSGNGYLGYVDTETGRFERVTFCPGYARGLALHKGYAIVGLSGPRDEPTFAGLALEDELAKRRATPQAGLLVIDLGSGDIVQWVKLEGIVTELYDVIVLPKVTRAKLLGFKTDEIRYTVTAEGHGTIWRAMGY
ncbi:MAG: TIGR03032 family protein [Gammaproteobacteria bacterium]